MTPSRIVRLPVIAAAAAVTWIITGTLFGDFTTFIAFDHKAVGKAILDGALPYRDFTFEYPPGGAGVLALPAIAGRDAYDLVFRSAMAGVWIAMALTIRSRYPEAMSGFLLASAALTFVIGAGFDIIVSAAILAAFIAASSSAERSATWLALGTVVKVVPAVLAPLLVRARPRPRMTLVAGIIVVAIGAAIGVPALLADEGEDPLRYHAGRLLHAESTIGSAVVLGRIASDDVYPVVFDHGSRNVADAPAGARTASIVTLGAVLALLLARGRPDAPATWMAVLLAIPALGPVASPQFLLWPLAFVGLVGRRTRWSFVLAGLLSASMFTGPYPGEGTGLALLTLVRNGALLAALVFSSLEALRRPVPARA